jgi:hypothetical protein
MPVLEYFLTGIHNTPEESKIVGGLVASMIAIVSIYVGAKLRDKD